MQKISQALIKAQSAFSPALKNSTNPHFRHKYADLSACIEAVIDALNNNGIFLLQKTHVHDNGIGVETIFIHESGENLSGGIFFVPAQKQDPQGYGSALTYARRYSLMAATGIAPEDDDGNAAKIVMAAPKATKVVMAAPKNESEPEIPSELRYNATKSAQQGTKALKKFWEDLKQDERNILSPILSMLKIDAQKIDDKLGAK